MTVRGRKPCALTLPHGLHYGANARRARPDTKPGQMGLPCREVGELRVGLLGQQGHNRAGQAAAVHVRQRLGIDHVIGVAGPQQVEEVQPALAAGGAEPVSGARNFPRSGG